MTDPLVYLAEPIDQRDHKLARISTDLQSLLAAAKFNVYRPYTAWRCGGALDPRVERVNRVALAACDCLVAYLPAGVPTIGVPLEIAAAVLHGTPVVVLSNARSFALAGLEGKVQQVDLIDVVVSAVMDATRDRVKAEHPDQIRVTMMHIGGPLPYLPVGVPSRAYRDDAGLDLVTSEPMIIEPGHYVDVPTTVTGVQLPPDTWGMITGRSSTLRKKRLHVPIAVIDAGWRGPLFVGAWNLGTESVEVTPGDRLGQLIVMPNRTMACSVRVVDQLDPHERGTNGFGSSGN